MLGNTKREVKMSRLFQMTWINVKRRWNKHYKGKMYFVTAKTLGMPPTALGSYEAANAWWLRRKDEIDAAAAAAAQHIPLTPVLSASSAFASSETAAAI
jgi:hypothetical protein